jgi:hypothetical protein
MQRDESALSEAAAKAYMRVYVELTRSYWRIAYPLFFSAFGVAVLFASVIGKQVPRFVVLLIAITPWLVYFTITFMRVPPPITLHAFRQFLLFVTCWYVTSTVVLIVAALLVPASVPFPSVYMAAGIWGCALLGWVAVPMLLRCSKALREAEVAS